MIKLVASLPAWGLPDISPFSNKVEAYLRLAKIPFQTVALTGSGLVQLPKGKLPVIINGPEVIADSAIIYKYLNKAFGDPLDKWLSDEQLSIATAVGRMMDESFYWYIVQIRYRRAENFWTHYAPVLTAMVQQMSPKNSDADTNRSVQEIRTLVLNQFKASGRGRHSEAEVEAFAIEELKALSTLLRTSLIFLAPGHLPWMHMYSLFLPAY